MSPSAARAVVGTLVLCLAVLNSACGGGASQPLAPSPPVVPVGGACQAAAGSARSQPQIVNGTGCDAATSSVVLLLIRRAAGPATRCSGTVIGSQAVLTAAHCVSGNPIDVTIVAAGTPDMTAQSFAAHPEYRPGPYAIDMAVITTGTTIRRRAIPLLVSRSGRVGETGVLAGWGLERIDGSSELRSGIALIDFVGDTFLTTRFDTNAAGTCSGDSGGPLLLSESGEWMLAGVTSTGVSNLTANAPPCETGISVYAGVRAASIASFIRGLVPDVAVR